MDEIGISDFETELETGRSYGDYLLKLGERVRNIRAQRGMTRKILARDSKVSERYLAQLEMGRGNISINLLRQVVFALGQFRTVTAVRFRVLNLIPWVSDMCCQ